MNKLGVKVYGKDIIFIDSIYYRVNSIKYTDGIEYNISINCVEYRYRIIDGKLFGIYLKFKNI